MAALVLLEKTRNVQRQTFLCFSSICLSLRVCTEARVGEAGAEGWAAQGSCPGSPLRPCKPAPPPPPERKRQPPRGDVNLDPVVCSARFPHTPGFSLSNYHFCLPEGKKAAGLALASERTVNLETDKQAKQNDPPTVEGKEERKTYLIIIIIFFLPPFRCFKFLLILFFF